MGAPKGATIVKEELTNEAGSKMREVKKASVFEEFIEEMAKAEKENVKPLSGDFEVIKDVDNKLLKQLQKDKRLRGWKSKTKTALVLKLAFLEKKKGGK